MPPKVTNKGGPEGEGVVKELALSHAVSLFSFDIFLLLPPLRPVSSTYSASTQKGGGEGDCHLLVNPPVCRKKGGGQKFGEDDEADLSTASSS